MGLSLEELKESQGREEEGGNLGERGKGSQREVAKQHQRILKKRREKGIKQGKNGDRKKKLEKRMEKEKGNGRRINGSIKHF